MNTLTLIYNQGPNHETKQIDLGKFETLTEARMNRDILTRKWKDANPILSQGYYFYCFTIIRQG